LACNVTRTGYMAREEWGTKGTKVEFRASESQKRRWRESAERHGRTLSVWICMACEFAATQPPSTRRAPVALLPPGDKLVRIEVRATGNQFEAWKTAARRAGRSRSSWMCLACDRFARLPVGSSLRVRRRSARQRSPPM
jgi:uncharacterized protein (DUF1778 family)